MPLNRRQIADPAVIVFIVVPGDEGSDELSRIIKTDKMPFQYCMPDPPKTSWKSGMGRE